MVHFYYSVVSQKQCTFVIIVCNNIFQTGEYLQMCLNICGFHLKWLSILSDLIRINNGHKHECWLHCSLISQGANSHSASQKISRLLCNVKFIAVYTDACYYTIFWHSETSQHLQLICLNSYLSLTSHLHLGRSGCLFPVCCITEILYAFHSHMCTKCLSRFILLNLITWLVFSRV